MRWQSAGDVIGSDLEIRPQVSMFELSLGDLPSFPSSPSSSNMCRKLVDNGKFSLEISIPLSVEKE